MAAALLVLLALLTLAPGLIAQTTASTAAVNRPDQTREFPFMDSKLSLDHTAR